jgi:hypothetical protein
VIRPHEASANTTQGSGWDSHKKVTANFGRACRYVIVAAGMIR